MVVAGSFTPDAATSIGHVHDQMAGPRVTIGWQHPEPAVVPVHHNVDGGPDVLAEAIQRAFREVLEGEIPPETPLLPDVDPVEWRGVGPYGHGGTGMTGGTPYGRPLALRAPARDRLELDQLPVTVGPWFSAFPPGLAIRVSLQGDVAQTIEVDRTALVAPGPPDVFARALREPISIRDLETARARRHLQWAAEAFALSGVERLARRADRLAASVGPGDSRAVHRLLRSARRSLVRSMTYRHVGVLPDDLDLAGLGPVERASGTPKDRRSEEPAYRDIGFAPIAGTGGDAWERLSQRIAEAAQALDLAAAAGDRTAFGDGVVEAPDGLHHLDGPRPADRLVEMLETVLEGMEWGDLVSVLHSFDIDVESLSVDRPTV